MRAVQVALVVVATEKAAVAVVKVSVLPVKAVTVAVMVVAVLVGSAGGSRRSCGFHGVGEGWERAERACSSPTGRPSWVG